MKKTFTFAIYPYFIKQYTSLFDELIKKYHITQIEIDVLAFLANNPEYQHAQDIVNIRGISKGHASIAVEKLVQKGFLTRTTDPCNRRCNILLVTQEASSMVKEIQAIQASFNDRAYQDFSEEDRQTYHRLLKKMYENLGGYRHE